MERRTANPRANRGFFRDTPDGYERVVTSDVVKRRYDKGSRTFRPAGNDSAELRLASP